MAMIDTETDRVVVRIVYDGAPGVGKTASLHALQQSLKTPQPVFSPDAAGSATQHFDWLDYIGGLFENRPIHCQILSTPGDPRLFAKREYLLQTADAVVFVLDSRVAALPLSLEYFRRLQNSLSAVAAPVPKILLQANFQDAEEALAETRLQEFFPEHLRIYGSIASTGESIRETFVFAVRLALERTTELKKRHELSSGTLDINSGDSLFEYFQQGEQQGRWQTSAGGLALHYLLDPQTPSRLPLTQAADAAPTATSGEHASVAACRTQLPDHNTPLHWLAPPLATQALLQPIKAEELHFHSLDADYWCVEHSDAKWRYFSQADWHYPSEAAARNQLHQQMQWSLTVMQLLPEPRYLALAQCADQHFHLWQIVAAHPSLSHYLDALIQTGDARQFADQLLECAEKFSALQTKLLNLVSLRNISLDTVYFAANRQLTYAGLLDMNSAQNPAEESVHFMHIMKSFVQPITNAMQSSLGIRSVLLRLNEHEATHPQLAENLSTLFIQ